MPRKSKRTQHKRAKRAHKRRPLTLNNVVTSLQPFASRFITKMKYAADVSTSAGGSYFFNLNSIYDPDRSGGGHQPYGFDNLAAIYNRYRVISCGWRITTTSGSGSVVQLGCIPSNSGITPVNFAELKEQPRAKYIVQLPGAGAAVLSGKTYIPTLVGRTKAQYMADDRYQALVTTDPVEAAVMQVHTANNSGTMSSFIINVMLEYTVEFFDVNNVAQS